MYRLVGHSVIEYIFVVLRNFCYDANLIYNGFVRCVVYGICSYVSK